MQQTIIFNKEQEQILIGKKCLDKKRNPIINLRRTILMLSNYIQIQLENEGVIIEEIMEESKQMKFINIQPKDNISKYQLSFERFPIEIKKRIKKIIYLPFNITIAIGKEVREAINEVIK